MTVKAKAIITAFYGTNSRYSYWNGCSTGGRQALMEAQRFPLDYDGIIAGAPANPHTQIQSWGVYVGSATLKDRANFIPSSKYPMIHQATVNACDALDGLKDGLISGFQLCPRSTITRVSSTRWARAPRRRSGCACFWSREWHIAAAARDRIGLTPLPRSSSGSNMGRPQIS